MNQVPNQNQTTAPQPPVANEGLGELHIAEIRLIRLLRERVRYGRLTIVTHNGIPTRVERMTEYYGLTGESTYPQVPGFGL